MIDTSKYEGHTPGQWSVTSIRDGSIPWNTADEELCADAPLLLAEIKRLREVAYRKDMQVGERDREVKRLREENRSLFLRLSDVQGQLNAIHRGDDE